MCAENKRNEEAIFNEAIEIKSFVERAAFIKSACGDDNALLARVEALLKVHFEDESFLKSPPAGIDGTLESSPLTEGPGMRIGRYKLLQLIGEGGFGVVYMAEQEKPIRRKVALKIIKLGMDTKQVIARFEAERQALALMDHPNIARVFDAGATDTGRPYFVMELVKGIPITEYCDKNNLNTQKRLELFIDVCKAVQHAHQKGIIHRDIKPSNVMITLHDGKPVPKIIDFGIAKATQQRLTEKTLFTEYHQFIGTPEYMSPEQAEISGLDVDTRSDIYSLGVLLYELLTGTTPFESDKLRSAAYDEIRRIIREEEPPKPSTRLSTLGEAITDIAKHRDVKPGELCKIVRGDLDWVVMKSLEKDRTRRYETANELARDIERHLSDEPVWAGPPSVRYRLHKFVCRHRTAVASGLLIAATIVAGLVVSTTMYFQAEQAREKETVARTQAERAEKVAQEQRVLAENAEEAAKQKAEELRRTLYINNIQLADAKYKESTLTNIHGLLATCPNDLRGWEWYYLWRISDQASMTLRGHERGVETVAFSPDGRRIVSGSADSTIKVWDTDSGSELMTLRGHKDKVMSAAFSPDGKRIVSSGGKWDRTIRVWDANSGSELITITGHGEAIYSVAFSPDGSKIVSGGGGDAYTLKVWDANSGSELITITGHEAPICSVAFSPDGSKIVSGSADGTIKVWDTDSGSELMTLRGHKGAVWSVAFSPDGSKIVSGSGDYTLKVWDANSGRKLMTLRGHEYAVFCIAFSLDGSRIVSGSGDYTLKVWDANSGSELRTLRGHVFGVTSVAFSPDRSRIVSGSGDATVKIWDADSVSEKMTLKGVTLEAFSPDGKWIVSRSEDSTLKVRDAKSGGEKMTLKGVAPVAFSPDGRRIVSGAGADYTLKVWDTNSGSELMTLKGPNSYVRSVAFSQDGKQIVSRSGDYTLKVWDANNGSELMTLPGHEFAVAVAAIAFSPDGRKIVSIGGNNTLKVRDADSGRELTTLRGHKGNVLSATFSPDGKRIVSSSDRTIRVWDANSGSELITITGHGEAINSVAFSPDGKRIVSGSRDNLVKVWDATTGAELLTLHADQAVTTVTFSPDGKTIAALTDDTLLLWDSTLRR
jgi:WD40 repeat protein/serine/threonine protein kinase